jgi:hypothetical protein
VLLAGTAATIAATAWSGVRLHEAADPLNSVTRHGLFGFEFPAKADETLAVITQWRTAKLVAAVPAPWPGHPGCAIGEPISCALRVTLVEERVVAAAATLFGLISSLTLMYVLGRRNRDFAAGFALMALVVLGAGTSTCRETLVLGTFTQTGAIDPAAAQESIELARRWAFLKVVLFMIGGSSIFAGSLAVALFRQPKAPVRGPRWAELIGSAEFEALMKAERTGIHGTSSEDPAPCIVVPPSGEPWLSSTSDDLVGLALSGGGIRSATFNLGLLEGLSFMGVLPHVDYLSTVSGGGYIGGFWSAWLKRGGEGGVPAPKDFPVSPDPPGERHQRIAETPEVRHLREFSRFLSPRLGFFEAEMWHAVIAFIGGFVPTLAASLAVLALGLMLWAGLTSYLGFHWMVGLALHLLLVILTVGVFERIWYRTADRETRRDALAFNLLFSAITLGIVTAAYLWVDNRLDASAAVQGLRIGDSWTYFLRAGSTRAWSRNLLVAYYTAGVGVSVRLFEVPFVLMLTSAVWLLVRLTLPLLMPAGGLTMKIVAQGALDRVVMRLLGVAIVWGLAAVLWLVGANLAHAGWRSAWTGLLALGSGGAMAILRNWLTTVFKSTGHKSVLERLRPVLPQMLSYGAIGLAIVWLVSVLVGSLGIELDLWVRTALVLMGVVGIVMLLDPSEYSLHGFYRDRISRAYLGATNPSAEDRAADNRNSEFRPVDDMLMAETLERPLHLVCCTANDLTGDQVETLTRGSRSATLSRHGVSVGGRWAAAPGLTMASALTASAAAFNPTMGSVSKQLGPAVTFLMATMNLRLGLWVSHPANTSTRWRPPGWVFFKEMFGQTHAGLHRTGEQPFSPDVHLSDGGHFDNLGLYELVRRHCRYIIVSDCGADHETAFDDLSNAVRRIREDFDIEVEIDLRPFKTADLGDRQHAVVGTVHYDRSFDKGLIVYFKPTLSGDEPADVTQYATRNTAFPHEGTGDQFYDEAQWESYRRLGFHSVQMCFGFMEARGKPPARDEIFTGARQQWYPTPPDLRTQVLEMTSRFGALEEDLRSAGQYALLLELFPESAVPEVSAAPPYSQGQQDLNAITFLMRAMQFMEDVWLACDLDNEWKHPINTAWINAFARWATAPSFVRWWPILASNFSGGFQHFLRDRFFAAGGATLNAVGRVAKVPEPLLGGLPDGLATTWWTKRLGIQPNLDGRSVYCYMLTLPQSAVEVQAGLVILTEETGPDKASVSWTNEDFFVPPSLWGAGLGTDFLKKLTKSLADDHVHHCDVTVVSRMHARGVANRQERLSFVEFYRSQRFRTLSQPSTDAPPPALVTDPPTVEAWVTLRRSL